MDALCSTGSRWNWWPIYYCYCCHKITWMRNSESTFIQGFTHNGNITASYNKNQRDELISQIVWHIPIAVYTVLDSWWLPENLSETCRVILQNKFWEIVASHWFYKKNISQCTVLWMSNTCITAYFCDKPLWHQNCL
jgi:hypothetical protein